MKETKIAVPEGYEVEKIAPIEGAIIVTFKEKERKLPKSWEEFCEENPRKETERYIDNDSEIDFADKGIRNSYYDRNMLPDYKTAEAVLALSQLIQLRNAFNGEWVPDWKNGRENKFMIVIYKGETDVDCANNLSSSILYFKTEELRDEFLRYFRPLIEKLKPLYGIKEGGAE